MPKPKTTHKYDTYQNLYEALFSVANVIKRYRYFVILVSCLFCLAMFMSLKSYNETFVRDDLYSIKSGIILPPPPQENSKRQARQSLESKVSYISRVIIPQARLETGASEDSGVVIKVFNKKDSVVLDIHGLVSRDKVPLTIETHQLVLEQAKIKFSDIGVEIAPTKKVKALKEKQTKERTSPWLGFPLLILGFIFATILAYMIETIRMFKNVYNQKRKER